MDHFEELLERFSEKEADKYRKSFSRNSSFRDLLIGGITKIFTGITDVVKLIWDWSSTNRIIDEMEDHLAELSGKGKPVPKQKSVDKRKGI